MAELDLIPLVSPTAAKTSSHTRLIEVLDALVRRSHGEPWGVRELAAELGESRSTINRILLALVARELAFEVGTGKYRLGPRLSVLTNALMTSSSLLECSSDALSQLAELTHTTALISICCPRSQGYFVAACEQAKSSWMFRPELGVQYPLAFGDLGRAFKKHLDIHAESGTHEGGSDEGAYMPEIEFPRALSVVTRRLENGLLIAVSVHSVHGESAPHEGRFDNEVASLATHLEETVARGLRTVRPGRMSVASEDQKSTTARMEQLLLLTCAAPNGLQKTSDLSDQLVCNMATAKRLIESAVHTETAVSVNSLLFPGPRLYQWAARIGYCEDIACLTRSIVQELVQETGETIAILSYDPMAGRAQFVDVIQGWRPIQYQLAVRTEVPLYAGAAGKAVLAYCDAEVVNGIKLVKITDTTITSRSALEQELRIIEQRGWATGTGERVPGAFGMAVPFFADGRIRGSISATIPQYRKDDRDLPRLTQLMLEASAKIGRLLSLGVTVGTDQP